MSGVAGGCRPRSVVSVARASQAKVDAAYAEVERPTRQRASNFAYGTMLLPRPKRRAIAAGYAFVRRVADIGDRSLPDEEQPVLLEQLRARLERPPDEDARF